MTIQTELLTEIEAFLGERGITESTFGRLAVNDGKFVRRLRDRENMTLATIDKVRQFIVRDRKERAEKADGAAGQQAAA